MKFSGSAIWRWLVCRYGVRWAMGGNVIEIDVCPICGDGINWPAAHWRHRIRLDWQVFYCFRNGCTCSIPALIQRVDGCSRLEAYRVLRELESGTSDIYAPPPPGLEELRRRVETVYSERPADSVGLPRWFGNEWGRSHVGRAVLDYGLRRGLSPEYMAGGHVGYCQAPKGRADNRWLSRLVFVIEARRLPVYWLGRSIGVGEPRYRYPTIAEAGGVTWADVLWGLDALESVRGGPVLLCEGILSAYSAGPGGVAQLGSRLSEVQASLLAEVGPEEVVILREEGVSEAAVCRNALLLLRRGLRVRIGQLVGGDPNDDPSQVDGVVRQAEPVSEFSLLKRKISLACD